MSFYFLCDSSALRSSISDLWFICTSIVYIRLVWFLVRDFVLLLRSFLDWFQSIQTRCYCLRLKDVLMCQASSYSAGKRTFQWILLNNILWMAPDHQAVYLGDNYTLSLSLLNACTVKKSPYLYFTLEEKDQYCYLLFYYYVILPYKVKRTRKIWGRNNNNNIQ